MIIAVHQPNYIPWLGLFDKINKSDKFVCLDTVKRSRGDYLNRNIVPSNSSYAWLTVPLKTNGSLGTPIKDIQIVEQQRWKEKHLKTIKHAYSKSPYFNEFYQPLEEILFSEESSIANLNIKIIEFGMSAFQINKEILRASTLNLNTSKSDLILEICQKISATTHIFGALGRDYVDLNSFAKHGIKVVFQDFNCPQYRAGENFKPNWSFLDALFISKEYMVDYFSRNGNIV
jgi:hypothetical protein